MGTENGFERRARESGEALLREQAGRGRPVTERWWWFLLGTAWMWNALFWLAVEVSLGEGVRTYRLLGLLALPAVPLFVWARARGERRRRELQV